MLYLLVSLQYIYYLNMKNLLLLISGRKLLILKTRTGCIRLILYLYTGGSLRSGTAAHLTHRVLVRERERAAQKEIFIA